MKTNKRCGYLALLISTGFLVGTLAGCGNARKAEAEDAAHAPTAPVVKVARRNLSNTLEIARNSSRCRKSKFMRKSPATSKRYTWTGERTSRRGNSSLSWKFPSCNSNCNKTKQALAGATRTSHALAKSLIEHSPLIPSRTSPTHGSRKCKSRGLS